MAQRAAAPSQRDLRLDFFRGLALFFIFIDHIPDNALSYFTLMSVGFCDAAEVFIFISGYTAALVYGRAMRDAGLVFATAQVWRRVWQLYVAHIFLFVIFTAEVSYTILRFNNPMYAEEMRVGDFLTEPHIAILNALVLRFQPTFLDILPLYIVLLAAFPLILSLLRIGAWAALVPSFVLYVATLRFGLTVNAYPTGHTWYFNPFAWQLLFVIGATLGFNRGGGQTQRFSEGIFPLSLGVAVSCSIIAVSWTLHVLWDPVPALFIKQLWPINKNTVSPWRIIDFLAIAAVVVRLVPPHAEWLRQRWASYVIRCGQQSLQVFCIGILLSVLAHFILSEFHSGLGTQLLVNVGGLLVMIGTAMLIDWYKRQDRAEKSRIAGRAASAEPAA